MSTVTATTAQQRSQQVVQTINHLQNLVTPHNIGLLVVIAIILVLLAPIVFILLDYLDYRRLKKLPLTYLELTPPSSSSKTAQANNKLFAVLHGLYSLGSFADQLMRRKRVITLEIVSDRHNGIRFIAGVPKNTVTAFQQTVTSYLPNVRFKETTDYLKIASGSYWQLLEFKLWRHFAKPLQSHDALAQHDPISFITNSLSKPEPGELLAVQLVLTPAHSREARRVHNKLLIGKQPSKFEWSWSWKLPFILFMKLLWLQFKILGAIVEFIGDVFYSDGGSSYRRYDQYKQPRTKALQAIDDKMLGKLRQPLFRANIRAFIVMKDNQRLQERTNGLMGSLASFE